MAASSATDSSDPHGRDLLTQSTHLNDRSIKDLRVESLRGLAILLVVFFHALQGLPVGVYIIFGHDLFHYLSDSFSYLRMPLFTVISGYVYCLRPVREGMARAFLSGKVYRILIPFTIATLLTLIARLILPTNNPIGTGLIDLSSYFVVGFEHLWYVPTIFYIFCIMVIFEKLGVLKDRPALFALIGVVVFVFWVARIILPFEVFRYTPIYNVGYLLPYFLWGVCLYRFGLHHSKNGFWIAITFSLVGICVQQAGLFDMVDIAIGKFSLLALFTGLALTLFLFQLPIKSRILCFFASYAFSIYLYHFFGLSAGKLVSAAAGFENPVATLMISSVAGVFLPIILHNMAVKLGVGRYMVGARSALSQTKRPNLNAAEVAPTIDSSLLRENSLAKRN